MVYNILQREATILSCPYWILSKIHDPIHDPIHIGFSPRIGSFLTQMKETFIAKNKNRLKLGGRSPFLYVATNNV
jgi:hypothetical protein